MTMFVQEFVNIAKRLLMKGKINKIKIINFYIYYNKVEPKVNLLGLDRILKLNFLNDELESVDISRLNKSITTEDIVFISIETMGHSFAGKSYIVQPDKAPLIENEILRDYWISDFQNPMINPDFTKNIVIESE